MGIRREGENMMMEDMYVDYSGVHLVFGESYANIEVIMSIKEYKKFKEMQKNMGIR